MSKFRIKGTKLPVIDKGIKFKYVSLSDEEPNCTKIFDCTKIFESSNFFSFGYKDYDGETYILAERKYYKSRDYYMFKESDIIQLAKKQGMIERGNRFPFKLSVEDARRIIGLSSLDWFVWRENLSYKWGIELLLNNTITITEDFYKEMRSNITHEEHELLDEIFGKDKEQCPYEDGELIFVKERDDNLWFLSYATGRFVDGRVETYTFQNKEGKVTTWKHHAPAKGVKLPNNDE